MAKINPNDFTDLAEPMAAWHLQKSATWLAHRLNNATTREEQDEIRFKFARRYAELAETFGQKNKP